MATYGVGPDQGFVTTRDRLKSLRERGTPYTEEHPEYWIAQKTGGLVPDHLMGKPFKETPTGDELPLWLQLL